MLLARLNAVGRFTKSGDGGLRESLLQAALALPTCVRQWAAPKAWAMAVAERRGLRRAITAGGAQVRDRLHGFGFMTQRSIGRARSQRRHEHLGCGTTSRKDEVRITAHNVLHPDLRKCAIKIAAPAFGPCPEAVSA
jgi:hypothetical protein